MMALQCSMMSLAVIFIAVCDTWNMISTSQYDSDLLQRHINVLRAAFHNTRLLTTHSLPCPAYRAYAKAPTIAVATSHMLALATDALPT